ncbi:protein kinase G11A-like [Musa troglodytarum]|uniref:Protein kinase G11A-like n=1 Tax=Musa troglodytarum TaxID=320322 RepID=A0A9E7K884_9LILI|nr:protein kinase G11A-like [Musa troglodytarum]
MQHSLSISFHAPRTLLLLVLLPWVRGAVGQEGFCSVPPSVVAESTTKPLYWKVTNPTLSPANLQDLPGFTRSVYRWDHALITPESHVFSPLPDWVNTLGAYLITPAMGAHFSMYLAKMQENSRSGLPPKDVERYISLENHYPEQIIGSTETQPLLETPGEVFELRKLLPTSAPYDFNIHIMDFQPGEYLNVKEVHYNQHGLLLLEGQGIYRLGDSWYPVQAGDVIWMAPFVPQWYAALGKTPSRYLLYKDVNRNPL